MSDEIAWDDAGLAPAIVQDADTGTVLMLGWMNAESLARTNELGLVTFFSRSKGRLWTKGEESGNHLRLVSVAVDCDADALLVKARPAGPTCHTGTDTCWSETNRAAPVAFVAELEEIISARREDAPEGSYTASLFADGINRMAQKVGEEAVELVIEAKDNDTEEFLGEAADLLFHYLVLLQAKDHTLADVVNVLQERHR